MLWRLEEGTTLPLNLLRYHGVLGGGDGVGQSTAKTGWVDWVRELLSGSASLVMLAYLLSNPGLVLGLVRCQLLSRMLGL